MNQEIVNQVIEEIDKINSEDPNIDQVDGKSYPKELLYSKRMSERLTSFVNSPSPELQIAARAHHIKRWISPRSNYPMDRAGYLQWRKELYKIHADITTGILNKFNVPEDSINKIRTLILKTEVNNDSDSQALEDIACLVFVEHYLEDFAAKHDDEKVVSIIQKTTKKMSEKAKSEALKINVSMKIKMLAMKALM